MKNFIVGISSEVLNEKEIAFIKEHKPVGFILFARNCKNKGQLVSLTHSLRCLAHMYNEDYDAPILIDQEGGRVARLRSINDRYIISAAEIGELASRNLSNGVYAAYLYYLLIASTLRDLGINVNCAPVVDLHHIGITHDVIGNRSFSADPEIVVKLANAALLGMSMCSVSGIIKHIPGHGRAMLDSHMALPCVTDSIETLYNTDFVPFREIKAKMAMTAHIIYSAIDATAPVTMSATAIRYIREQLNYAGILLSDDLSMNALQGSIGSRALGAITAGCDIVLHCNGKIDEMIEVAQNATVINRGSELHMKLAAFMANTNEGGEVLSNAAYEDLYQHLMSLMNNQTGEF